ncbi:aminotransferase class III-fold pyridoxal phosphate-dependent enzyme [Pelagibacterales bacterium SAG-MED32]|nr:aminotransferase class III-fold pyridoxal phosphate-dependent enzyme [Pelagibacterales bacterium SAG-MED32]
MVKNKINQGTGQKLYKKAKKIIPGGNMLLSKRPEMFLPDLWPSYYKKTKGCYVWDMDNIRFLDMSIMGIGTNILGYSNKEVDDAVKNVVKSGNMSTLNCPEEVYLAEKLIELHKWADMAKFARSGGEANAMAIRIARASSGKDNVAICGYHGWHDWYLASNINDKNNLTEHLLPNLESNGVPKALKNTIFPFKYNDYEALYEIVKNKNIGTIKMEVLRNEEPRNDFLQKVRKLADEKNIILIFDECTSGFRQTFGGLHKYYNVEPDIAMFGKALGNGYAITSVIGKKEIMKNAQSTFISSTFWTERIGPAAAIKTLEVMKKIKSWKKITNTGSNLKKQWSKLASKNNLNIKISGLAALASFSIESKNSNKYKTYITQEMLRNRILASNIVYVCTEHSNEIIDKYLFYLDKIFKTIGECEEGRDIDKLLIKDQCHVGFRRLN